MPIATAKRAPQNRSPSASPGSKALSTIFSCACRAGERTDAEIACDAVGALDRCVNLSHDRVKFVVCDRWVTLEGQVGRYDQCEDAEESVRELSGVIGVTNLIIVKPTVAPEDIKARIEESFRRAAQLDAQQIVVETRDRKVVLRGRVRSWAERTEAWRVAWQIS